MRAEAAIACLRSPAGRLRALTASVLWQMSKTPTLIWAQRVEKVFVTWESLATKEVNVTFSEGLLTIEGTLANGDVYKLENLPLFLEIEPEESKWFKNDRCSSHSPVAAGLGRWQLQCCRGRATPLPLRR